MDDVGELVLYGNIPETCPQARGLALRKWATLAQVEAVAQGERPAPVLPYDTSAWGGVTWKPGRLYLHVFEWPHRLVIHGLANTVRSVRMLADPAAALTWRTLVNTSQRQHRLVIDRPEKVPDTIASVIEVRLADEQVKLDSLLTL